VKTPGHTPAHSFGTLQGLPGSFVTAQTTAKPEGKLRDQHEDQRETLTIAQGPMDYGDAVDLGGQPTNAIPVTRSSAWHTPLLSSGDTEFTGQLPSLRRDASKHVDVRARAHLDNVPVTWPAVATTSDQKRAFEASYQRYRDATASVAAAAQLWRTQPSMEHNLLMADTLRERLRVGIDLLEDGARAVQAGSIQPEELARVNTELTADRQAATEFLDRLQQPSRGGHDPGRVLTDLAVLLVPVFADSRDSSTDL
jgi:hypothetical protein